jgi:hypothetical protein
MAPTIRLREGSAVQVVERRWGADEILLLLWGTGSGVLAFLLMYAVGVLQGRRREWRRESLDGVPVLLSRDIGPAVIGWRTLDIVMPEWVQDLEAEARALVLRHEMEHVARRDPRLLMRTWLGLIAMPWNPALWWQLRRLRRAIEVDCDARVVASGADVSRYGSVLLEAVGRCNRGGLPAFAAFAERSADLEARIKALTAQRFRFWRGRALAAAVIASALTVAACLIPDSMAPGLSRHTVDPAASSQSTLEWVQAQLVGHPPADIVILYRSHDGRLLKTEMLRRPSPGARPERVGPSVTNNVPTKDVESVEVVRGPKLMLPGIDGVVVVTLKVRAQVGAAAQDEFKTKRVQSVIGMLDFAAVVAGPRFGGPQATVSYLWYETDSAGALRGAGYASERGALRNRNGRRPVESGSVSRGGRAPNVMHWARYVVP